MENFKIILDSAMDLCHRDLEKYDIDVVPFTITFDGITNLLDGVEITKEQVYERMKSGGFPKTSLPSIQSYYDYFKKYCREQRDILCLCLSSGISGSYFSAVNAAELMLEEYPERKIKVIDTQNVSVNQGLLAIDAGEYRNEGKSVDEVHDLIMSYKDDNSLFLTVDDLNFLFKGGRLSKTSAIAGSLLGIKPVISFEKGKLEVHSKVRGRKKALVEIVDSLENRIGNSKGNYRFVCLQILCEEDAQFIKEYMGEKNMPLDYEIMNIGVTVASHTGPGTIGVGCIRKRI